MYSVVDTSLSLNLFTYPTPPELNKIHCAPAIFFGRNHIQIAS